MAVILPSVKIDSDPMLARFFVEYQIHWIQAEDSFHAAGRQVFALGEKSVRIGWTYADGFKNVRKRLRFKNRDYLFDGEAVPGGLQDAVAARGYFPADVLVQPCAGGGGDCGLEFDCAVPGGLQDRQ